MIDTLTGLVIDYAVLSKYCVECVNGVDVKRDAGCKCPRGECIDRFGGGTFFSREQSMPVLIKNSWTCCCSAKCQPSYGEAARLEAKKTSAREN